MASSTLLQFILFNFLQNRLKWVLILSCWNLETKLHLSEILMWKNIYVEYKFINEINLDSDLEGNILKRQVTQIGIFIDINCEKSEKFLSKASKEKLFIDDFYWLIYDEFSNSSNFANLFENFQMAVDADIIYFGPNLNVLNSKQNFSFITHDVYNNGYNLGGKLNITAHQEVLCSPLECKVKNNLSSLSERTKYQNRWFLKDITMRASTIITHMPITEPKEVLLSHLRSEGNLRLDRVARYGYAYLLILIDTLECSVFYNFTENWSHNETVGGVLGALADHSAELASTPILPSLKRIALIVPTMSMGYFRQVCIFRTPRNAGIRGTVYLDPFSSESWLFFGCLLLIIGLLLWVIFYLEYRQLKKMFDFVPSVLTTCLISFGSACNQGSFLVPLSMGGRTVFFSLSLLTFIIYNYYTSIVVAILLGSPVKSNIKTMGQLAESNLDVAFEPISYTKTYFNFSQSPEIRSFVRNKIANRRNPNSVWMPIDEGLRRVRDQPGFAYGPEALSGYYLIELTFKPEEICDLNEVLVRPLQVLHAHVPKNSSYLEIIKLKQIRILESGIHRRLQHIWLKHRLQCEITSSFVVQVGLEYTAPLFILMAGTFVMVIIVLAFEILWHKFIGRK